VRDAKKKLFVVFAGVQSASQQQMNHAVILDTIMPQMVFIASFVMLQRRSWGNFLRVPNPRALACLLMLF
jgi:hypothetical protein